MKKQVILLLVMLFPLIVGAQESFLGVYYEKKTDGTYKVVKHPSGEYSGIITIVGMVNGVKVTEIGDQAFMNNRNLRCVHMPITIERIGVGAFGGCTAMESIEIPENVNFIGAYAFGGNESLADVYCYAKNIVIEEDIFYKTNVKKITLSVPEANLEYYKKAAQWKKIKKIESTNRMSTASELHKIEMEKQKRILEEHAEFVKDSTLAAQGDVEALVRMATKLENGESVAKDMEKAFELYKKAGNQGNVRAQLRLGEIYSKGLGVSIDKKEAVEWYRKAAEAGNADGQYGLGSCYYYGIGTAKDVKLGMEWINKAAEQGHKLAKAKQKLYEEEYGSYWKSEGEWRIVFPNGVRFFSEYKDQIKLQSDNFTIDGIKKNISKEEFDNIEQQKSKFKISYESEIYVLQAIFEKKEMFRALSDNEKIELAKKELAFIDYPKDAWISFWDNSVGSLGYYKNGRFYSEEEYQTQKKAREEKEKKEALSTLYKMYGKKNVDAFFLNKKLLVGMPLEMVKLSAVVYIMKEWNNGKSGEYEVGWGGKNYRVWTQNGRIAQFRNWTKLDEKYFNKLLGF